MRPERRKRHHYIPRFLQKHFCEADGMLWYGIRDTQEVKRVSPRDAFVEKELYTSYQKAHECPNDIAYEPDDRYEREFAELEDRAAPAIEKLIEGTRRLIDAGSTDLLRSMSPAAITACKELLVSMSNRTPAVMKSAIARSRHSLRDAIAELDLQPIQRFSGAVQDDLIKRLEKSAMAHVASSSHRHVPRGFDLNDCGLAVAAHTNPKSRFIVGSHGVAHLPIAEDPEDLDGTWLPISPSNALGLDDDPTTITLLKDRERLRRRINEALAKRSKLIAGDSRRLVWSMLQRR